MNYSLSVFMGLLALANMSVVFSDEPSERYNHVAARIAHFLGAALFALAAYQLWP